MCQVSKFQVVSIYQLYSVIFVTLHHVLFATVCDAQLRLCVKFWLISQTKEVISQSCTLFAGFLDGSFARASPRRLTNASMKTFHRDSYPDDLMQIFANKLDRDWRLKRILERSSRTIEITCNLSRYSNQTKTQKSCWFKSDLNQVDSNPTTLLSRL